MICFDVIRLYIFLFFSLFFFVALGLFGGGAGFLVQRVG